MLDRPPRVLIVESEFLIAIDAEHILTEKLGCVATIMSPDGFLTLAVGECFWDTIVLDTGSLDRTLERAARLALTAGAKLVFTSTHDAHIHGVPGFEEHTVVMKPYTGKALIEAVLGESASQPAKAREVTDASLASGP